MSYESILFSSRRRHRAHHAQPARPAQQLQRRDARGGARRARTRGGRRVGARAAADRRGPRLLRGTGLADRAVAPGDGAGGSGRVDRAQLQAAGARLARAADARRVRGQRRRGGRRRQHRARLRHRHRGASRRASSRRSARSASFPIPAARTSCRGSSARRARMGLALLGDKLTARAGGGMGAHLAVRRRRRSSASTVDELLAQLAQAPTRGLAAIKRALHASADNTLDGAARRSSATCSASSATATTIAKAWRRSSSKRPPRFTGPLESMSALPSAMRGRRHRRRRDGRRHRADRRAARPSRAAVRHAPRRRRRGEARHRRSARASSRRRASSTRPKPMPPLARIAPVHALGDLRQRKLVVEAIVEDLDGEARALPRARESSSPRTAILASNTSSLSITALARRHEASGAHRRHAFLQSGAAAAAGRGRERARDRRRRWPRRVYATAQAWGKTPVHASSTPGFIVNRCARPFYAEALRLLAERAADARDDRRRDARGGGFRMGPFELMDLIGLDVNFAVTKSVWEAYFHDPRYAPSVLQEELVAGRVPRPQERGAASTITRPARAKPAPATESGAAAAGAGSRRRGRWSARRRAARAHRGRGASECERTRGRAAIAPRTSSCDGAFLALTDGRTATAWRSLRRADLVVFDLALDYARHAAGGRARGHCGDAAVLPRPSARCRRRASPSRASTTSRDSRCCARSRCSRTRRRMR